MRRGEDLGPHPEDPPHLKEIFPSLKSAYLLLPNVSIIFRLELCRRGEDLGSHPEDPPHLKEKFQSLKCAYLLLPNVSTTLRLELWRRGEDLGPHPEDPPHLREKFQSLKSTYSLLPNVSLPSGWSCGGGGRTWVPTLRIRLISGRNSRAFSSHRTFRLSGEKRKRLENIFWFRNILTKISSRNKFVRTKCKSCFNKYQLINLG